MGAVAIVDHDPRWAAAFAAIAAELGGALGPLATRIDHVGSTAVPGLPAKDVIDVQVGVADAAGLERACAALAALGYAVRQGRDHAVPGEVEDEAAWRKGFASEPVGRRRTHVHVRVDGAPNHRYALLFRDYLREHPATAAAYADFKRRAAELLADDAATYTELKDPVCDLVYLPATRWAEATGWTP